MQLYPYQHKIIGSLRKSIISGHKRIVLCSPVGSGKTFMFCQMISAHLHKSQKHKVLIITHRIELLKQAGKDFENIEEIKSGNEPDLTKKLMAGMCETIFRRIERYKNYLHSLTMVVIDEIHLASFDKLFPYFNENTIILGCSATPFRSGKQPSLDTFFTDIVQEVDTPELIELGFLSKAKTYGIEIDLKGVKKKGEDYDPDDLARKYSENKVYQGVLFNYNKICPGTKTILFASNIESSKEICLQFILAGLPARHLDSEMSDADRANILEWFKDSKDGILCNVSILTTGYNCPDIKTVILYRATKSIQLYIQMIGRASRIVLGLKNEFYLLDHGNNVKTHNFYEAPRTWSLQKKKKKDKVGPAPVKICPKCNAIIPMSSMICTYCNFSYPELSIKKNEFAELKLLTQPEIWKLSEGKDLQEKVKLCKAKLLKSFRVLHTLTTKEEGLEFCRLMGYSNKFAYVNKDRFKCFESL